MTSLQHLLAMPEAKFVLIPLVATFLIALVLHPLGWTWSGLALAAGFYLAANQLGVFDFSLFETLLARGDVADHTGKILLLGLAALVIGLLYDIYWGSRQQSFPLLMLLAGAAAFWLSWGTLTQQPLPEIWPATLGAIAYLAWMAAWSDGLREQPVRATSIGWVLSMAIAGAAWLGPGLSTPYGQLSMAFAAAAGGFWLATIVMPRLRGGSMFALPVLFIGALLSLTGVMQQQIPAYFLLLLALLPVFGKISLALEPRSSFGRALVAVLIMLPIGVAAATAPLWPMTTVPAAPAATQTAAPAPATTSEPPAAATATAEPVASQPQPPASEPADSTADKAADNAAEPAPATPPPTPTQ
jgi:hypothetical protein